MIFPPKGLGGGSATEGGRSGVETGRCPRTPVESWQFRCAAGLGHQTSQPPLYGPLTKIASLRSIFFVVHGPCSADPGWPRGPGRPAPGRSRCRIRDR